MSLNGSQNLNGQGGERESGVDGPRLCPKSRAAVESLVEAGQDLNRVPAEHRPRCEKVAALLSALGRCEHGACPKSLTARTLAKIKSVGGSGVSAGSSGAAPMFELCDEDHDALEALVSEHMDARRVAGGVRERAERAGLLLSQLDATGLEITAEDRASLVARTLARVDADVTAGASRMRVHSAAERGVSRRSWRLADIAGIAAVVGIGAAVLWPTVSAMRQRSVQVAGAARMGQTGAAMAQYGSDWRGSMPMATASLAGGVWWNVGKPAQSNSANLFTLRRTGYATLDQLTSPGNAASRGVQLSSDAWDWNSLEQVSYSYQNQFATQRACMAESEPSFVVLADKSPVALRAWRGERVVYFNENSPNHGGRGQNALRLDGTVKWLETPFTESGDNLWLPQSVEKVVRCAERLARGEKGCDALRGIEQPSAKNDVFLCP